MKSSTQEETGFSCSSLASTEYLLPKIGKIITLLICWWLSTCDSPPSHKNHRLANIQGKFSPESPPSHPWRPRISYKCLQTFDHSFQGEEHQNISIMLTWEVLWYRFQQSKDIEESGLFKSLRIESGSLSCWRIWELHTRITILAPATPQAPHRPAIIGLAPTQLTVSTKLFTGQLVFSSTILLSTLISFFSSKVFWTASAKDLPTSFTWMIP